MPRRTTIHLEGLGHGAPIPNAAMVGRTLMSSGIAGVDPATGELASTAEDQAVLAFANMIRILDAVAGSIDDVVHITVFVTDLDFRQAVNVPWLEHFPDEHDRPARHTLRADLPGGMLVQLEIIADIEV